MGFAQAAYGKLPVWGQHAAVSVYGLYWKRLRFGSGYREFVREYRERERLAGEEWSLLQRARLGELLAGAAERVPYYRELWSPREKLAAREGRLEGLPLLDKEPIRRSPRAFLDDEFGRRARWVFHTSGTTGTPLAIHWSAAEIRESRAQREARSANWAGVSFDLPRATFSGRMVEPDPHSAGPYYRYNWAEGQVYFSAFHLREETAAFYVAALRRHGIRWLTGYAVSYYLLAKLMLEGGLTPPPLEAVVTTSEKVTPGMRAVMEKAYGCRVYEEYSSVENSLFVSECERGRLHASPEAGVIEILSKDGTPCAPGEAGEVVATGLTRRCQPLIRFRLGDCARWSAQSCPCGREMPVLEEVLGRVEDLIVGLDGRKMVRFHGIFTDQPHIREGQIIQETLGRIRVKIVPAPGFGPSDEEEVARRIRQRLGERTSVVVETVERIPRGRSGKFQPVISLLRGSEVPGAERTD